LVDPFRSDLRLEKEINAVFVIRFALRCEPVVFVDVISEDDDVVAEVGNPLAERGRTVLSARVISSASYWFAAALVVCFVEPRDCCPSTVKSYE
jgi:hypothetical protein